VLPIVAAYIKYYGREFALRITALMFVVIVIAALIVDLLFGLAGLIPDTRPSRSDIFGSVELDYKLALNVLGLAIFASLFYLTARRGSTDPVCGMKVDRSRAVRKEVAGEIFYFCSDDCWHAFEANPDRYTRKGGPPAAAHAAGHAH